MPINNWWESDPAEVYWLEVRQEPVGLGEYLRAPQAAGDGNSSWSYELTSYVQPGDRIFHWHKSDSGEPAIIGWSEAVGPLETIDWSWQARGSRGRERGRPTTGPTWNMPLRNYSALTAPITRSQLNLRRTEILEVIDAVATTHGKPVYAPFQNYGGRELRAVQGYLAKFPAALVALIFDMPSGAPSAGSSRRPRASRAQGYMTEAEKRGALERHAVDLAIAHYRAAGAISVEELGKPYDLRVTMPGDVVRHVEVKGTIGVDAEAVLLTQGEVDHAARYQPTDLFVVDGIAATRSPDGVVSTSGGNVRLWSDWRPASDALRPTHLRYTLPRV